VQARNTNDYMIVSVRSKMCLTVKGGKDSRGTPVIQDTPTNSEAQQWTLIHQSMSLYIIASKLKQGLFLGIRDNSMNEGAALVLTNKEEYAFWRITGEIAENSL
jgi:hypothetical protein